MLFCSSVCFEVLVSCVASLIVFASRSVCVWWFPLHVFARREGRPLGFLAAWLLAAQDDDLDTCERHKGVAS